MFFYAPAWKDCSLCDWLTDPTQAPPPCHESDQALNAALHGGPGCTVTSWESLLCATLSTLSPTQTGVFFRSIATVKLSKRLLDFRLPPPYSMYVKLFMMIDVLLGTCLAACDLPCIPILCNERLALSVSRTLFLDYSVYSKHR